MARESRGGLAEGGGQEEEEFRDFSWYDVRCSYEKLAPSGRRYEVEVLHGINGQLHRGEMLAVLGESPSRARRSVSFLGTSPWLYLPLLTHPCMGMCACVLQAPAAPARAACWTSWRVARAWASSRRRGWWTGTRSARAGSSAGAPT